MIGSRSRGRPTARGLALAALLMLLAVDWLALDDITTGVETSHALEWGFVLGGLPLVGLCALAIWRWRP